LVRSETPIVAHLDGRQGIGMLIYDDTPAKDESEPDDPDDPPTCAE